MRRAGQDIQEKGHRRRALLPVNDQVFAHPNGHTARRHRNDCAHEVGSPAFPIILDEHVVPQRLPMRLAPRIRSLEQWDEVLLFAIKVLDHICWKRFQNPLLW